MVVPISPYSETDLSMMH